MADAADEERVPDDGDTEEPAAGAPHLTPEVREQLASATAEVAAQLQTITAEMARMKAEMSGEGSLGKIKEELARLEASAAGCDARMPKGAVAGARSGDPGWREAQRREAREAARRQQPRESQRSRDAPSDQRARLLHGGPSDMREPRPGQDPGLYLDFRAGREWLRANAKGKHVLCSSTWLCGSAQSGR